MSKVKTQYGDLTEKQWKLVVVEKLITIEKLLLKVADVSSWPDEYKQTVMRIQQQRHKYELNRLQEEQEKKEQEAKKT